MQTAARPTIREGDFVGVLVIVLVLVRVKEGWSEGPNSIKLVMFKERLVEGVRESVGGGVTDRERVEVTVLLKL